MGFLADLDEDHEFVKPKREILCPADLVKWPKSEAYNEYVEFIVKLNTAVIGKNSSTPLTQSQNVTAILGVLRKLSEWIDQTPAIEQPQRFGNKAFKIWYTMVTDNIHQLLRSALEERYYPALDEITVYLVESFGNSTRIDYGSGHEMNFVLFLYCLFRIKALNWADPNDQVAAVIQIFDSYMTLARKLQITYRMEPAGSHGAWSLDDYQFIPFIWGSAQLTRNGQIEPNHMTDPKIVEQSKSEFMFFSCVDYILQVKTGPFHEHSNQLWNISGIESWTKVNNGLIKMYKAEIISKFPVIQHVLFGSLLSIMPLEVGIKTTDSTQMVGAFRIPPGPRPLAPVITSAQDQTPIATTTTPTEESKSNRKDSSEESTDVTTKTETL